MSVGSRRRALRVLAVTASAVAAAATGGCGKGSYAPYAGTLPSPAAASRPGAVHSTGVTNTRRPGHSGPVTVRREQAFARAVNLAAADIPGARVKPRESHRAGSEPDVRRCGGVRSDAGAVQLPSANFVRGSALTRETLSSRVTVLSNAKFARAAIALVDSAAWRACYADVLRKHFVGTGASGSGVKVDALQITSLHVGVRGADATFGLRIAARLSSTRTKLTIRLYLDTFGFALGRSEIAMNATSYVQPEPARTEQDLLMLMDRRAGAHPL